MTDEAPAKPVVDERDGEATDLSSGREVRAQTRRARNAAETFEHDLRVVLSSTEGRRMLWRMLSGNGLTGSGVFEEVFAPGAADITAYRAGLQAQSRFIMAHLLKPDMIDIYRQMVVENATGKGSHGR